MMVMFPSSPPLERPTVALDYVEPNRVGEIVHLTLNNSHSFIEECEPFVYQLKDGDYQTLSLNISTNNTGFQISDGGFYSNGQEDPSNPVVRDLIDIIALCRNTPARGNLTRLTRVTDVETGERAPDYLITTDDLPSSFARWYLERPEYRDQPCEARFGKMVLRAGKPWAAPGEDIPLELLKPFDVGDNRGDCVWDANPNTAMNGRVITPTSPPDRIIENAHFRYRQDLTLSCPRMLAHDIWKHPDQLNITMFRRPTYAPGAWDAVTVHIPLKTTAALPYRVVTAGSHQAAAEHPFSHSASTVLPGGGDYEKHQPPASLSR